MGLPDDQSKSNSKVTLVSSGDSSDKSGPIRYTTVEIDVTPSTGGSNFSVNGGYDYSTGSSNWTPQRTETGTPDYGDNQRSRKKRLTMAAGISFLFIALAVAVVLATYYGVTSGNPVTPDHPVHVYPGSTDTVQPPSESVLGTYARQSVASDASECSKRGNDILKLNGNAVDAAITTALCAGLYHSHSCGIGGGFFMVVYNRHFKNASTIDAREVAPGAASENMYVVNKEYSSVKGWHAIAVPGEIAGYWEAYRRYGSGVLNWTQIFQPAIDIARDGLVVNNVLAGAINNSGDDIRSFDEGLTDLFVKNKETGELYQEGDLLKYPALAETLRIIAEDPTGVEEFYRGKIAQNLIKDITDGKGLLTLADLRGYRPVVEDALHLKLRDNSNVYGVPPPAGSLVLQYIINIMDGYGYNTTWDAMSDDDKILFYQRFTEAMKFAYARRTEMGDDAFVPAVTGMKDTLLSPWFAKMTRTQINEEHTSSDTRSYGVSVVPNIGKFGTSHISVVDQQGNAVAITTTINTHFGSKRVSKLTGIILNNEMDDFTTSPDKPNYYGLAPSVANRIVPGKRPQSSCSPTVVTDDHGEVRVVIGASGGSRIISAVANALLRILYLGQNVKAAIDAPRLHHQLLPMILEYEANFVTKHLRGLEEKGHNIGLTNTFAVVQGITRQQAGDLSSPSAAIQANCDFRKKGAPDGI